MLSLQTTSELILTLFHYLSFQTKCILCTRAFNRANREERVPIESTARAMQHEGICYRNTIHGPAVSEEYAATEAARRLLFDDAGNFRGEDSAVFLDVVVADNDVRAPSNLIKEQHSILGEPASGRAEHIPDIGHVIKDCNNELFGIREKDPSFKGVNLLQNERIRAIMGDVTSALHELKDKIEDDAAQRKCLRRIEAVVPHHCGDHSKCRWPEVCGYTRIKAENPGWSKEEVNAEYAKTSRFPGKTMGLSSHGIKVLMRVLFKRFDKESIKRVGKCLSSNPAEAFFGITAMFSGGKRLCLEHTDLWKSMVLLGFCRSGNIERTHDEISAKLKLEVLEPETKSLNKWKRKRERDYARNSGEAAKKRRHEAKALKDQIMMKEDAKKRHKSAKVPVKESARVKTKKASICSKCGQPGHTRRPCPMPSVPKPTPNVDLLDWGVDTTGANSSLRGKRFTPDLIDWCK